MLRHDIWIPEKPQIIEKHIIHITVSKGGEVEAREFEYHNNKVMFPAGILIIKVF
jgi:hypothetical protein